MSTRVRWTFLAAVGAILGVGAVAVAVATSRSAATGDGISATSADAQAAHRVTVYKSPACGCCSKWVEHLEAAGFEVEAVDVADISAVKVEHGVPPALGSCHTATVGGYVLEGHVPADLIARLLEERPEGIAGLAVGGMPMGSPGMEGPRKDSYKVVAFDRAGGTSVYATR